MALQDEHGDDDGDVVPATCTDANSDGATELLQQRLCRKPKELVAIGVDHSVHELIWVQAIVDCPFDSFRRP